MKLTLERDALNAAIGRVSKSVGKGTTIAILGDLLLRAAEDGLTIVGCDLDIETRETIPARVSSNGALAVPAGMLQDIVGRSRSGTEMQMESVDDGRALAIKAGRGKSVLHALPAEDFPELPCQDTTHGFSIEPKVLARLLAKVEFAISTEETRFYLNGVFLHCFDDGDGSTKLRAVATDGHRLALVEIDAPVGVAGMPGVIVPRKTVGEIIRIGKTIASLARVDVGVSKMRVDFGQATAMVSKIIEGTFPDYTRLIPHSQPRVATIDREMAMEGLGRVSAVAGEARIVLRLSPDRLEMATKNPAAGEATEEMEISYAGDDFEIGFDAKYLRDCLDKFNCDRVEAGFDSPGSPMILRPKQRDGSLILLMPRSK